MGFVGGQTHVPAHFVQRPPWRRPFRAMLSVRVPRCYNAPSGGGRGCVVSTKPDHTGPSHTTFVCVARCPVLGLSCPLSCVEARDEPCQSAQRFAFKCFCPDCLGVGSTRQPGMWSRCILPSSQMHSSSLWAGHCLVCPVARMEGGEVAAVEGRGSPPGGGFGRQLVA